MLNEYPIVLGPLMFAQVMAVDAEGAAARHGGRPGIAAARCAVRADRRAPERAMTRCAEPMTARAEPVGICR